MAKDVENRPNVVYVRRYNSNKNTEKVYVHPKEFKGRIPEELRSMCPSRGDVVLLEEGGGFLFIVTKVERIALEEAGEHIPSVLRISKEHTDRIKNYKIVMPENRAKEDMPQMQKTTGGKGAAQKVNPKATTQHKPEKKDTKKRDAQQKDEDKVEEISIPTGVLKKAQIDVKDKLFFEVDENQRIIITKTPVTGKGTRENHNKDYNADSAKTKLVDLGEPIGKADFKDSPPKVKQKATQQRPVISEATEKKDTAQEPRVFKDRLRAKLAERKMSQSELARQLGVTGPNISQFVTGKRFPTLVMLKKMAEVLEVTPQWLSGNIIVDMTHTDQS